MKSQEMGYAKVKGGGEGRQRDKGMEDEKD